MKEHQPEVVGVLIHEGVEETGAPLPLLNKVREVLGEIFLATDERSFTSNKVCPSSYFSDLVD